MQEIGVDKSTTMLLLFLFFTLVTHIDAAEIIIPKQTTVSLIESSNTTLSCTYEGSAYSLHWYRQTPGSKPEFLLLIDESGKLITEAQPPYPRLNITIHKDQKKVDLHIYFAALADSALYYCALQPTVTGNTNIVAQKLYSCGKVLKLTGGGAVCLYLNTHIGCYVCDKVGENA